MEVLDRVPAVSPDGCAVVFVLSIRGREVEGAIARDALEDYFWLPPSADPARTATASSQLHKENHWCDLTSRCG